MSAMATTDDAVCQSMRNCSNLVKAVIALLQSLQPELVLRTLVIVINMLSVEDEGSRQEVAVNLCEANLLPILGTVMEQLKGEHPT